VIIHRIETGPQAVLIDMAEDKFDVAVIGGGPAGIMAAVTAAESGAKVILIEKNKELGKKLLLTGNGRCNITNAEFDLRKLAENYGKNGEFLFHAFSVFGPERTIKFFEKLGVKTKIEDNKRVFPISGSAVKVLEALIGCLADKKVKIFFNSEVSDVDYKNKRINKIILKDKEIEAKKYIFCTGGKAFPLTGSDGSGYKLAEKLGHTITKPMPALSPIKLKEAWVKNLQGISLDDVKISTFQKGKKQFQEEGKIIFTHFGISGPAVLNISGRVGDLLEKGETKIYFDLFTLLNQEELSKGLEDDFKKYPNRTIENILSIFVPERLAEVLLDILKIDKNKIGNSMPKIERTAIVKIFKNFEATPEEILGFEQAVITRGGISLKEIDHKTMKSKIINNLFFAGEIIGIDGKTGGFNLQNCWSTGYLAGKNAYIKKI
jgi:predicted Rossmann fold flavoprotein